MLMRYHWGLGIGHKYSWEGAEGEAWGTSPTESRPSRSMEESSTVLEGMHGESNSAGDVNIPPDSEDLHDGMEDRENEDLGDDSDFASLYDYDSES